MWWDGNRKAARNKLNKRTTPEFWVKMTVPDVTAYYSALNYNIKHNRKISNANRRVLSNKAQKQRHFLASRAPAPNRGWRNAAVRWNSPTNYNPIQNIQNQVQGAADRRVKKNLITSMKRRRRASPKIKAYR